MCITFKASEMEDTNLFFHGEQKVKKRSSGWWDETKTCDKNNWKRLAVAVTTKSKNHCFLFSPRAVIGVPCQDQENNKNNYNTFMRVPGNCTNCRWFWYVNFKASVVVIFVSLKACFSRRTWLSNCSGHLLKIETHVKVWKLDGCVKCHFVYTRHPQLVSVDCHALKVWKTYQQKIQLSTLMPSHKSSRKWTGYSTTHL